MTNRSIGGSRIGWDGCLLEDLKCRHENLSKKLHNHIFGPEILHTKSALIATIFTHNETAQMH